MAYNFKSIADVDMVEAPAETANVLIEEDGIIKKAPKTAVGGAGGSEPDMIITINGSIDSVSTSQCTVTNGGVSNVASKLSSGKTPIVKIINVNPPYNNFNNEFDAFITTYGENYWLSSFVIYPAGPGYYKLNMTLNSDGSINSVASTSV